MPVPSEPMPDLAAERADIDEKITAARTAVTGLTDDASDTAISAAKMAVAAARMAVTDSSVPDEEKSAHNTTIATIEGNLGEKEMSIMAAREAAAAAMRMADAETGKAMHAALGGPASDTTPPTYALANIAAPTLSAAGLAIDAAAGAGSLADATDPASMSLEAGDSAGALGSWMGMDYALTTGTGDAMVTDEARVYTNQGAPDSEPFAEVYTLLDTTGNEGYIAVDGTAPAEVARVMATPFVHSGTQSHPIPDRSDALYVRGTYDGAPGEYRCTGTCTSTNDGKGSPSALAGVWHLSQNEVSIPLALSMVALLQSLGVVKAASMILAEDDTPASGNVLDRTSFPARQTLRNHRFRYFPTRSMRIAVKLASLVLHHGANVRPESTSAMETTAST